MITKAFRGFLQLALQSGSANERSSSISAKDMLGSTYYLIGNASNDIFPRRCVLTMNFDAANSTSGTIIGSGDTTPTENDYQLASRITSGISSTSPAVTSGTDASGNPYLDLVYTLSNSTSSDIIIKEVGYVQQLGCNSATNTLGVSLKKFLLDRTVLENPLTVPANGTAVLKYTLKTIIS